MAAADDFVIKIIGQGGHAASPKKQLTHWLKAACASYPNISSRNLPALEKVVISIN